MAEHEAASFEAHTSLKLNNLTSTVAKLTAEISELREQQRRQPVVGLGSGLTDWQEYKSTESGESGLYMDVDTRASNFRTDKVVYSVVLEGEKGHWGINGLTSIYPRDDCSFQHGFRIHIHHANFCTFDEVGGFFREAMEKKWRLSWVGLDHCT